MLVLKIRRSRKDCSDGKLVHVAAVVASDDNLLREFFFRLPVRSLLRFKSVSKHWLSVITDPCFIRNYSFRNPVRISGIFLFHSTFLGNPKYKFISINGTRNSAPFKSLSFMNDRGGVKILHSCNGLLCCSSFRTPSIIKSYYICNPTIKQYTTLPRPCVSRENHVCSLTLAFNPLKSPEYKVVCVRSIGTSSNEYKLLIYSSSAPYWRISGGPFTACDGLMYNSGKFWNGAVHWVVPGDSSLCFHVNREVFVKMPMPPVPSGQEGRRLDEYVRNEYVGASGDHLYLVLRYDYSSELNILELESDYSRWNAKYRIDLVAMMVVYPEMVFDYQGDPSDWNVYQFSILLLQGEPDIQCLLLHIPNKIIMYNLREATFRELQELSPRIDDYRPCIRYWRSDAYSYMETISCV